MKARKGKKSLSQLELIKGIRKVMPKPSKVIVPKKGYNRKDRNWSEEHE